MEMDCDESERQRRSHVSSSMPSLRASTARQLSPGPRSASCPSSIAPASLPLWVLKHPLGPLSCHSAKDLTWLAGPECPIDAGRVSLRDPCHALPKDNATSCAVVDRRTAGEESIDSAIRIPASRLAPSRSHASRSGFQTALRPMPELGRPTTQ